MHPKIKFEILMFHNVLYDLFETKAVNCEIEIPEHKILLFSFRSGLSIG